MLKLTALSKTPSRTGTTLVSILISFSILIERLHVRAIRTAFRDMCRDVLLKIDDFHCVVCFHYIYRYARVWSSGPNVMLRHERRIEFHTLPETRCINTERCVNNEPWLVNALFIYAQFQIQNISIKNIFSPLYTEKIFIVEIIIFLIVEHIREITIFQ